MAHSPGKLIVIYGINNLGKTTQARLLVKRLAAKGIDAHYLKYPLYDLAPTGPQINAILRRQAPFPDPLSFQKLFAGNRRAYDPRLRKRLEAGQWLVAEDYVGTGIAWGVAHGLGLKELAALNRGLAREDCAVLLDGARFLAAREKKHLHEFSPPLISRARTAHRQLAGRYHWPVINANQPVSKVHRDILAAIGETLAIK